MMLTGLKGAADRQQAENLQRPGSTSMRTRTPRLRDRMTLLRNGLTISADLTWQSVLTHQMGREVRFL